MRRQDEHHAQVALFQWAALESRRWPELEDMFATLNGLRLTIGQAVKAKAAGMTKGIADIWLPVPRGDYHGLVIELKKAKGGKKSDEQVKRIARLVSRGYFACFCAGFDEARETIENYMLLD